MELQKFPMRLQRTRNRLRISKRRYPFASPGQRPHAPAGQDRVVALYGHARRGAIVQRVGRRGRGRARQGDREGAGGVGGQCHRGSKAERHWGWWGRARTRWRQGRGSRRSPQGAVPKTTRLRAPQARARRGNLTPRCVRAHSSARAWWDRHASLAGRVRRRRSGVRRRSQARGLWLRSCPSMAGSLLLRVGAPETAGNRFRLRARGGEQTGAGAVRCSRPRDKTGASRQANSPARARALRTLDAAGLQDTGEGGRSAVCGFEWGCVVGQGCVAAARAASAGVRVRGHHAAGKTHTATTRSAPTGRRARCPAHWAWRTGRISGAPQLDEGQRLRRLWRQRGRACVQRAALMDGRVERGCGSGNGRRTSGLKKNITTRHLFSTASDRHVHLPSPTSPHGSRLTAGLTPPASGAPLRPAAAPG